MRKLELIQRVFAIGASVVAVLSGLAFFVVPGADEIRFRYFGVFLLRSAIFDLAALAVALAFGWVMLRVASRALAREFGTGIPWTAPRHRPIYVWLGLVAIAFVLLRKPAHQLLRARALYWTQLSRPAYATRDLARIGRLARTGRVNQAYTLASTTYRVLKDTPEEYVFAGVMESLAARLSRARTLRRELSPASARSWNPIAQRQRYFELAEAVRLNPEDYTAADALGMMRTGLMEHGIPADARALCSPTAVAPQRRTVSPLESEIRIQNLKTATEVSSGVSDCVRSLRARWELGRVGCILAISRRTRQPFTRAEENSWSLGALPECRGIALEDAYI